MSESSADYAPTTRNTGEHRLPLQGSSDGLRRKPSGKSSPIWSKLEKRILELSYKKGTAHLGSCLTAVWVIDKFFAQKGAKDIFILSAGHAGLALYVVMEKYGLGDAEQLFDKHGVHPNTDTNIACSSGSLGHGLGIAIGFAISNPDRDVYCLLSDGEMAEGSVWEAIRIASDLDLTNLFVSVNANGYSALGEVDLEKLNRRIEAFGFPVSVWMPEQKGFYGLDAHYHVIQEDEWATMQSS